jgi:hypothetical protein
MTIQCKGITHTGAQCGRFIKHGEYCKRHISQAGETFTHTNDSDDDTDSVVSTRDSGVAAGAVAEPVVAEPVVVEPVAAEPVAAEPVVVEPVVAEPVVVEPVVAEPVVVEPVAAEPVVAEPVVAEPVVAEPVVAEPVVAEPVVVEPVVAEPVELADDTLLPSAGEYDDMPALEPIVVEPVSPIVKESVKPSTPVEENEIVNDNSYYYFYSSLIIGCSAIGIALLTTLFKRTQQSME